MKNIIIISGFLGVGKTTLIQKFLKELIPKHTVMIIENDFGEINIDGELLGDYKLIVREINAGCICCSLVGDFEKAIVEIERDFSPDIIIIEPSGVANSSQLVNISLGLDYGYSLNSINIIDGINHFLYLDNFSEFYKNQILSANTIIINRIEKLSTDEIHKVTQSIQKINSFSKIFIDKNDGTLEIKEILNEDNLYKDLFEIDLEVENIFNNYSSLSLITPNVYKEEILIKKLNSLIEDKNIKRIKGIINLENRSVRVDYTWDFDEDIKLETLENYQGVGKLVTIGDNFDEKKVKDIFGR